MQTVLLHELTKGCVQTYISSNGMIGGERVIARYACIDVLQQDIPLRLKAEVIPQVMHRQITKRVLRPYSQFHLLSP